MPELYAGAQRHLPEMQHLWGHHRLQLISPCSIPADWPRAPARGFFLGGTGCGVFLRLASDRWRIRSWPSTSRGFDLIAAVIALISGSGLGHIPVGKKVLDFRRLLVFRGMLFQFLFQICCFAPASRKHLAGFQFIPQHLIGSVLLIRTKAVK